MPVVSRARLEARDASAFCREWRRGGGTCAAGAAAHPLSLLLGQRTGVGGMNKAAATIPQTRIFDGFPEEIRNVRVFVAEVADGCPVVQDVVLLASELATNAVLHTASGAGGAFFVSVYVEGMCARVEVLDLGSATAPAVRRSGPPGESGAGLGLVETLADRWGFHGGNHGRVVWFEVDWQ